MQLSLDFDITLSADDLARVVDDEVREYAAEQLYRDSSKYLPYKTGALQDNVKIDAEGIHYLQWYAPYTYVGINPATGSPYNFRKTHHPLATDYWDEAFVLNEYDDFLKKIERFIRDRKL